MGLSVYPAYMGAMSNSVNTDRKVLEWLSGGLNGVGSASDFQVSAVPGNHQIQVAKGDRGVCFIRGKNNASSQGSYMVWTDGTDVINLPVTGALPFIVAVIVRVSDSQYGTIADDEGANLVLISGTPNASPVAPSDATIDALNEPGGWYRLANIRINPSDSGEIPSGQITDTRTVLPSNTSLAASIATLATASTTNATAIANLTTVVNNLVIPDVRVQTAEPTTGLVGGKTVWIS